MRHTMNDKFVLVLTVFFRGKYLRLYARSAVILILVGGVM